MTGGNTTAARKARAAVRNAEGLELAKARAAARHAAEGTEPKRGRGRPRQEGARRRILSTRVTDTELGMCMGAAEACGESLGDWLRRIAIRSAAGA